MLIGGHANQHRRPCCWLGLQETVFRSQLKRKEEILKRGDSLRNCKELIRGILRKETKGGGEWMIKTKFLIEDRRNLD
jgi:hypothetical protein